MRNLLFAVAILAVAGLTSCVPARKFQDCQALNEKYLKESNDAKAKQTQLKASLDSLMDRYNALYKEREGLVSDTAKYNTAYRREHDLNKELNALYEQVVKQNKELLTNATSTTQKLNQDLEDKKRELDAKQKAMADQQKQIDQLLADVKEREGKVNELQSLINKKDSTLSALKNKVMDALVGFDKGDLSVYEKDGQIYVSMSDKLLFKSGSYAVDTKGKEALKKVAEVLSKMQDITVRIEGHTDSQPMAGTGTLKDNWDLSVMRATSITRLLQDFNVDPKRIVASGHGEYFPVADNSAADGRAKNRRTEIILSPNLSELYKVINGK